MKKSKSNFPNLEIKFRKEKLESNKMQYLLGGNDHGGQGGDDDPWDV